MALEHLLSYAVTNGMDADEVKAKVRDKLRADFLRGVCYEYLITFLDATGLSLMKDLELSEEDVQKWYEDPGNLWHSKEIGKLTGVWPKQELIDILFYMTEHLAREGMDTWRTYMKHLEVKPSVGKAMEAYKFVLGDRYYGTYRALGEIAELTGVKIPEDLVQARSISIMEEIFEGSKDLDPYLWDRVESAAGRMKRLFEATGIVPNLPEDTVQDAYRRLFSNKEKLLLYRTISVIEMLTEVTNRKPDISETEAKEIFKNLLVEGELENIGRLKKILQTGFEFSYEDIQEAYSRAVGTHYGAIKLIRAIKDLTGVKPSEEVAIKGYAKLQSCCISGDTELISAWKEISGIGMPEETAHKYIGLFLKIDNF